MTINNSGNSACMKLVELRENAASKRDMRANELRSFAERKDLHHNFCAGQIVKWKPGLKNRKFPQYDDFAIVTHVLDEPIFDPSEQNSASPYFLEPLKIVIGVIADADFIEFHVDGSRFEPVE